MIMTVRIFRMWCQVVDGGLAVMLPLLLVFLQLGAQAGEPHAPCYNCEIYHLMQSDQAFHDRQVNSQCHYPCKCPNDDARGRCKGGVTVVKDGCDCCYMCARQQGDLCDYKDKCDEDKGLYCDFKLEGGIRGICRARSAKPCDVDGKTYKDGEQFKPNCSQLCTCQNGQYACSTLCPQEERPPSSAHCKEAQLVSITGRCCKEWVCPHAHSLPDKIDEHISRPDQENGIKCKKETTAWSACSVTCGMGISMRVTNDNEDCQPVQEQRLCLVRPCELKDEHLIGTKCKSTWKEQVAKQVKYNECESKTKHRLKYCSNCKKRKCCGPDRTKNVPITFTCPDGKEFTEDFMWIRNCKCRRCKPPLQGNRYF